MVDPLPELSDVASAPHEPSHALFGDRVRHARRYAELLGTTGIERGLLGPREGERIWHRHVLNCAVLAELIETGSRVVDVGSGAGLPGIPLAIARPDLDVVLVEPLARRIDWLRAAVRELGLDITTVRGRAEEREIRQQYQGADVVTARAVAPLGRLATWSLPLLRVGGELLAVKGASVESEIDRDAETVRSLGGSSPRIVRCGARYVRPPSTVVIVRRSAARGVPRGGRRGKGRP